MLKIILVEAFITSSIVYIHCPFGNVKRRRLVYTAMLDGQRNQACRFIPTHWSKCRRRLEQGGYMLPIVGVGVPIFTLGSVSRPLEGNKAQAHGSIVARDSGLSGVINDVVPADFYDRFITLQRCSWRILQVLYEQNESLD